MAAITFTGAVHHPLTIDSVTSYLHVKLPTLAERTMAVLSSKSLDWSQSPTVASHGICLSSPWQSRRLKIVVSLLSAAQTGVKWIIGPNNLFGTNDTPIRPIHLISANQFRPPFDGDGNPQPLRALWGQRASPWPGRCSELGSPFVHSPAARAQLLPSMQRMMTPDDDPFEEQTPNQNTHQLVADISPKDCLAMSQLPLSYP